TRSHDLDLSDGREQLGEEVGATGGIAGDVEAENGDLHAVGVASAVYRAASASATRAPERRRSTRSRPALPSRTPSPGSVSSASTASASAPTSPPGTSSALSRSTSTSGTTPTRLATTGRPAARYSKS